MPFLSLNCIYRMNHIFYSFVKIALVIILLTFSINKTYSEEENVSLLQQMELLREDIQKKLFDEIKGRIKLDDESLPYKDTKY